MRVLIDITHPAHLHFFRPLILRLRDEGHSVHLTGREKDILGRLAAGYGLELETFGVARPGLLRLAIELAQRQRQLLGVFRRFRPDVALAVAGTYVAAVGRLFRVPTYVFYDTEHARLSNALAYPFATCVFVPRCYARPIRWRHERYDGYHELAYLHPRYFRADPEVVAEAGLDPRRPIALVRFVSWGAVHDVGERGLTLPQKVAAVERLASVAQVVISSEEDLPKELAPLRLDLDLTRIHHLISQCSVVFGESATMCSEATVLGVPSVYVSSLPRGYIDEQERSYGIVSSFEPKRFETAVERAIERISDPNRDRYAAVRDRLLEEKIDVTDLLHRVTLERPYSPHPSAARPDEELEPDP